MCASFFNRVIYSYKMLYDNKFIARKSKCFADNHHIIIIV